MDPYRVSRAPRPPIIADQIRVNEDAGALVLSCPVSGGGDWPDRIGRSDWPVPAASGRRPGRRGRMSQEAPVPQESMSPRLPHSRVMDDASALGSRP